MRLVSKKFQDARAKIWPKYCWKFDRIYNAHSYSDRERNSRISSTAIGWSGTVKLPNKLKFILYKAKSALPEWVSLQDLLLLVHWQTPCTRLQVSGFTISLLRKRWRFWGKGCKKKYALGFQTKPNAYFIVIWNTIFLKLNFKTYTQSLPWCWMACPE